MTKFFELSEENINLVDTLFQATGLHNYMDMKAMGISKAKTLIKVQKNNPVTEYIAKVADSINIQIYEEAFDRLDENTKKMLLEDAFAHVAYDSEKDKIIVGAPEIVVTLGGREKYGNALVDAAEAGVMAIQQVEDEKRATKGA